MRILLTGATGFLGSALARRWSDDGHDVLMLARTGSSTRRIDALSGKAVLVRIDAHEEVASVSREFRPQAIVHTACAYGRAGESPLDILDVNLRFGTALLQTALSETGHRTVFLNTGTVLAPELSLYALSKTQFSAWGAAVATRNASRLQFIDVNLQQMYGAGDDRSKFITHVIEACRAEEPRLSLTTGEQRRDLIHIDDVVQAYTLILQHHAEFEGSDRIDVGSGRAVRMRDFVELAKRLSGAATVLDFGAIPYRPHEAMLCVANTSRLVSLGWRAAFDLESGLRQVFGSSI